MSTYNLPGMSLLRLIEAYGNECAAGGGGYTADDSEELLEEITTRVNALHDADDWAHLLDGKRS